MPGDRTDRRSRAAVALVVAVGVLTGCGGNPPPGVGTETQAKTIVQPSGRDPGGNPQTQGVRLPPRGKWFGFSGGFFAWTGFHPELDQGLTPGRTAADALAVGANAARVEVPWWDLEPVQGQVNQKYLRVMDQFVDAIQRGGGRVVLVLDVTPPWAAEFPNQAASPPRDDPAARAAFARYAAFVAKRWPKALAIETWNEPNGANGWKPGAQPARYAGLHRVAAAAIRRVNPHVKVLVGGLIASSQDNANAMRPQRFLKGMFAAGLKPSDYDGLALHPYPVQGPSIQPLDGGEFAKAIDDFELGYRWRDPHAKLWVTETGVTTTGPLAATPQGQADGIVALTRKLLSTPQVAAVFLHTEYDWDSAPADSPEHGFGVLQSRRGATPVPKPAFCALRRMARKPAPFPGCS